MAGDHKCPVCQATFTRPQHVARHMRSHTGDRPYKCQYCGDQFSRSDLLSRHVNKCHSNEKPLPVSGSRRRGSARAAASRAMTSKQACDQCVQSSLPCDGCNPCAKCVQRQCRCTFVKFYRQTAPTGPGHNPQLSIPSPARLGLYSGAQHPTTNDFPLRPAHLPMSMAENLYSDGVSLAPLYPSQSSTLSTGEGSDFSSQYLQPQNQHQHQQFQDPRASPVSWVGWDQRDFPEDAANDDNLQHLLADPSGMQKHPLSLSGTAIGTDSWMDLSRRPSVEFSSGDETSSSSIPSSTASSEARHSIEGIPVQQTFPGSVLPDGLFASSVRPQHQHQPTDPTTKSEGGFSSVFGLMSLDDPAVVAGHSSDATPFFSHTAMAMTGDPNATPMPMRNPPPPPSSKELDTHELREFWKLYMRTPLSGPGPSVSDHNHNHNQNPGSSNVMNFGPGTPWWYRRTRVASLPSPSSSAKMPTPMDRFLHQPSSMKKYPSSTALQGSYNNNRTLHGAPEDLRSYEAAVLAREVPMTLSLKRKGRAAGRSGSGSSSSVSPQIPQAAVGERERDGGDVLSSSSSLANVFGARPPAPSGMHVPFAPAPRVEYARSSQSQRQSQSQHGSGSASPVTREGSRESSVDGSRGGAGTKGEGEGLRPSFKRLPSQTLGPANTKRVLVMRGGGGGDDGGEGVGVVGVRGRGIENSGTGGGGGGDVDAGVNANSGKGVGVPAPLAQPMRRVVNLAERRRRMSAPAAAGSEARRKFSLGLGALP